MWCSGLYLYVMLLFILVCLDKRVLGLSLMFGWSFVFPRSTKYAFYTLMTLVWGKWTPWRVKWTWEINEGMKWMTRGPTEGYARNDTGPSRRVCPEWHGALCKGMPGMTRGLYGMPGIWVNDEIKGNMRCVSELDTYGVSGTYRTQRCIG
jgi:hypothetical protein